MRIIVIGAGVIGLAIAEELVNADAEVTLLDAGPAMGGTSSRGLAWVNASNKSPWPYFRLNSEGVQSHSEQSAMAKEPWFYQVGTVASQSYRSGLEARLEDHAKWDYQFSEGSLNELLGGRGLRERYADEDALFYPQEGWIDIEVFKEKSLKIIVENRGILREHMTVVSIEVINDGIRVQTDDGQIFLADAVVNAAGAGAVAVAAMVGRSLPMRNRWGVIAQVATTGTSLERVLMHDLIDIRPGLGGVHFLHSDQVDGTLPANPEGADLTPQLIDLLARAKQLHATFDDAEILGSTIGLRPIPADGLPIIGSVSSVPGYYEAVSHSGLTLAPALARALRQMIMNQRNFGMDLSMFSPERFSNSAIHS